MICRKLCDRRRFDPTLHLLNKLLAYFSGIAPANEPFFDGFRRMPVHKCRNTSLPASSNLAASSWAIAMPTLLKLNYYFAIIAAVNPAAKSPRITAEPLQASWRNSSLIHSLIKTKSIGQFNGMKQ